MSDVTMSARSVLADVDWLLREHPDLAELPRAVVPVGGQVRIHAAGRYVTALARELPDLGYQVTVKAPERGSGTLTVMSWRAPHTQAVCTGGQTVTVTCPVCLETFPVAARMAGGLVACPVCPAMLHLDTPVEYLHNH